MLYIVSTVSVALSLVLFCMGVNFYIDLHLGHEFLSTTIALEVASLLISVAIHNNIKNINVSVFALLALWFLIASSYALFMLDFTSVPAHFVALLCLMAPVVLVGIYIINNRKFLSAKAILSSILVGSFAGVLIAFEVMEREGIFMLFMLSSAALTLAILLQGNISNLMKIAALCVFALTLSFANSFKVNDHLADWTLFDQPISKISLNLLKDPGQRSWLVEDTIWGKGGRVDIVSTSRSRNEGSYWAIHDANILVPFVHKAESSVSWWNQHYPLLILPFELKKPSTVLTVSAARGPDTEISRHLYGAETTSVYADCAALSDFPSCDRSAVNIKLDKALNSHNTYDLISFSIFNQVATPYVGVSASHEAIQTKEIFRKLYESLNNDGLLVINSSDQVMLHKTLSYVWRLLSDNDTDKIINFENNIRILMLNKYSLKNDAYNYIVLVSKDGFTPEDLDKINNFVRSTPVTTVIYDSVNNEPPYILFKQLNMLTVSAAVTHLTRASSWKFKRLVNFEPSSIFKPDFFHLLMKLHPFTSVLSVTFLLLGLYGLIFSHRDMRNLGVSELKRAPVLSILLFQAFLCATAFVLVLYSITSFTTASLGYSSQYTSTLLLFALTVFVVPHVFTNIAGSVSKSIRGFWFYPVILLLCIIIIMAMTQDIVILLGVGAQAIIFILAVLVAFCSGLVHYQSALFIGRLYPGVWFWFWCMTSVGTVLGVIIAKYILIEYDLIIMIQTAMAMFIFLVFIAWWSVIALQGKAEIKADSKVVAG